MTAFDQLLTEFADFPGNHIVRAEDLEEALVSVALKDCKPGFITVQREETTFTLEGIVAFLFVCRDDPEATPKLKQLGDLVERAIEEIGVGKRRVQ